MSRRFLLHAERELDRDPPNRLQASEKVWGAATHALKAIGKERGWNTGNHDVFFDITEQLRLEFDDPELTKALHAAQNLHSNFYNNVYSPVHIRDILTQVRDFVDRIERLRQLPPRYYKVPDDDSAARLKHLLGRDVAVGEESQTGFTHPGQRPGQRSGRRRHRSRRRDDGDGPSPVPQPRPDIPPASTTRGAGRCSV